MVSRAEMFPSWHIWKPWFQCVGLGYGSEGGKYFLKASLHSSKTVTQCGGLNCYRSGKVVADYHTDKAKSEPFISYQLLSSQTLSTKAPKYSRCKGETHNDIIHRCRLGEHWVWLCIWQKGWWCHNQGHGKSQRQSRQMWLFGVLGAEKHHKTQNGVRVRSGQNGVTSVTSEWEWESEWDQGRMVLLRSLQSENGLHRLICFNLGPQMLELFGKD
jgi:hypothetical protein